MQEKRYTIIKSEEQYKMYCRLHEEIACSGREGQDVEDELELLVLLLENFDKKKFVLPERDPIESLKSHMENNGMDNKGLAKILEVDLTYATEILDYKRGLSTEIILKISERFKIRPDVFNKPYMLKSKYNQYLEDACVMNSIKELPIAKNRR